MEVIQLAKMFIFSQDKNILAQSREWVELKMIDIIFIDKAEDLITNIRKDQVGALIQINPGNRNVSIFDIIQGENDFCETVPWIEMSDNNLQQEELLKWVNDLQEKRESQNKPLDPKRVGVREICELNLARPLTRKVIVTIVEPNKLIANTLAGIVRMFKNAAVKTIIPSPNDIGIDIPPKTEILFISDDLNSLISSSEIVKNLESSGGIAISISSGAKPADMQFHFPHKSLVANNLRMTEIFMKILLRLFDSMDVIEHK